MLVHPNTHAAAHFDEYNQQEADKHAGKTEQVNNELLSWLTVWEPLPDGATVGLFIQGIRRQRP